MIRLVYISSAKQPFSTEKLIDLLTVCRDKNTKKAITGVLFYHNQTFLQVLEGEEKTIDALVGVIKKDPRHTNFTILEKTPITQRQFSQWSMGFKDISDTELNHLGISSLESFINQSTETNLAESSNKKAVETLMLHVKKMHDRQHSHEELPTQHDDKLISYLHIAIRAAVKVLAVLMVIVIYVSVIDVAFVMYQKLFYSSGASLDVHGLLTIFGAFLAVLIAIEIFINITLYIRNDVMPIKLVVATALMAISRKVIVFDFKSLHPSYIWASAAVVLALGITYWLLSKTDAGHE